MHPVFQILKNDLYRTRWQLGLWGLLIALQQGPILAGVYWDDLLEPNETIFRLVLLAIHRLAPYLVLLTILPAVIHADPLVSDRSFWLGRHISRPTLLSAKLLYIGLALIAPALVTELLLFIARGASLYQVALAVPEIVLNQLCFILPIALLAALTPNLSWLLLVLALVLIGAIGFSHTHTPIREQLLRLPLDDCLTPEEISHHSFAVAQRISVSLLAGAVLIYQYLTKRTARSALLVAVGALLCHGLPSWGVKDFLQPSHNDPLPVPQNQVQVRLREDESSNKNRRRLVIDLAIQGLPPDCFAIIKRASCQLQLSDGKRVEFSDSADRVYTHIIDPTAIKAVSGNSTILFPVNFGFRAVGGGWSNGIDLESLTEIKQAPSPFHSHALAHLLPDIVFAFDITPDHLRANHPVIADTQIDLIVYRNQPTAELPLKEGAHWHGHSEHLTLIKTNSTIALYDYHLAQQHTELLFDSSHYLVTMSSFANIAKMPIWFYQDDSQYALFNNSRKELILQFSSFQPSNFDFKSWTRLRNRILHLGSCTFTSPTSPLFQDWLAHAKLIRLDRTPVAVSHHNTHLTFLPSNTPPKSNPLEVLLRRKPDLSPEERTTLENIKHVYKLNDFQEKQLIQTIIKKGWQQDAKEILCEELEYESHFPFATLRPQWLAMIASYQDPATYPDLKRCLLNSELPWEAYDSIKHCPGLELSTEVRRLWQEARLSNSQCLSMAAMAAENGITEALLVATNALRPAPPDSSANPASNTKPHNNEKEITLARRVLREFTPATGDDAALVAWFDTNRDKLVFDPKSKKYLPADQPKH